MLSLIEHSGCIMNIGDAAKLSQLSSKTIRYYEQIKLLSPAKRAANGYRDYSAEDLEQLCFLQRARRTGFDIEECRQLLELFKNRNRESQHVKTLVLEKADQVQHQIAALQAMHEELLKLAETCQADEGPHCAIIDQLSDHPHHEEREL